MAGAARIAPPLLLGKLFRLMGADATVFPNHGGRFGYSPATCRALADAALAPWGGLGDCMPVPAGGMTTERVTEMLQFYGKDVMLLIGGGLLAAGPRMTEETAKFAEAVARDLGVPTRSVTAEEAFGIWDKFTTLIVLGASSRTRSPRSRDELGWVPVRCDMLEMIGEPRLRALAEARR